MKAKNPILSAALLIGWLSTHAATYYVSSTSGNDSYTPAQAQSLATPWKTLAKVNSFFGSLNPGDQVLLQAGGVFQGPLIITRSGTSAKQITISSYGSGAPPVINGFAGMLGWTSVGGNIWQSAPCAACGVSVNMVDIGNVSVPMGRYPNAGTANGGYAQIQSYNGTTSITDSHLGSGNNWTGATLVIRKNRWVIENDPIVTHSGSTITYQTSSTYPPAAKYGYFIENSVKTLDAQGEWYYNPTTKQLSLYSTTNPSGYSVQASMIDTLVKASYQQYIHINGINFQGANKSALAFNYCNFITITNSNISFSGRDGIDAIYSSYTYIEYVNLNYTNNNGITLNEGNGNMVSNCTVQNTGTFPGQGGQPLNAYLGLWLNGNDNTVQYNRVLNTGYTAIYFQGTGTTVLHNYVNKFCFVKDDGGGIYTWNGNTDSTNKHLTGYVTGNIVDSGMSCPAGTDSAVPGIAHGIYLDENTTECYVTGNTVVHSTAGVFFQDSRNCSIQNNTLYDNVGQLVFRHALPTGTFNGNDISYNIEVTNVDTENITIPSSITTSKSLLSYGYLHNNYYAMVAPGTVFSHLSFTDMYGPISYGNWQSPYGEDIVYSNLLNLNFAPYIINNLVGSNLYTKGTISTQFSSAATGSRVIVGTPVGALTKGTWYVVNFAMTAPDAAHVMLVFLEQVTSPYPQESPVISVPMAKGTANYSVAFQATGSTANGGLVFQIANTEPGISVSNITLYQANVTPVRPDQNVIFQYNATNGAVSIKLTGTYQDATGASYSGNVSIPAYGSILLFKKA